MKRNIKWVGVPESQGILCPQCEMPEFATWVLLDTSDANRVFVVRVACDKHSSRGERRGKKLAFVTSLSGKEEQE